MTTNIQLDLFATVEQPAVKAAKKVAPKYTKTQLLNMKPTWVSSNEAWEKVVDKTTKVGTVEANMGACCAIYKIYSSRDSKC